MYRKNMFVIPPSSSFEKILGIQGNRIKKAVFIPNRSSYPNLASLESILRQLKFSDIVDWFTDEKGFQRGGHRLSKLFDLYRKGEIDIVICYSSEDLESYENSLDNPEKSIQKTGIPIYCIRDSILIRNYEIINLS
jgi:hypothetical protein